MLTSELLSQLESPVDSLATLLPLLAAPLDSIGLLPPKYRKWNSIDCSFSIRRHLASMQHALIKYIIPTWNTTLAQNDATPLIEQFFCPDAFSFASPAAGEVALLAYSSILALPLNDHSVYLLTRLSKQYPLDRLHSAIFSGTSTNNRSLVSWEDYIKNLCAVPAKVANTLGSKGQPIPPSLEQGEYFNTISSRCEHLICSLSSKPYKEHLSSITYLLEKLVRLGAFPSSVPTSRTQPSFFQSVLLTIRARSGPNCSAIWHEIFLALPSSLTLQYILTSLLASLTVPSTYIISLSSHRSAVKKEAMLLRFLVGPINAEEEELWQCVCGLILGREWDEYYARIFSCWIAGDPRETTKKALEVLLTQVLETWSSPEHIKHSLLARHRYMTALLLLTISNFPPRSRPIDTLGNSSSFISAISLYIGHLDHHVRRCGMLAAEVVAHLAGKKLDFGDWDGDDPGKAWCRDMRKLLMQRDIDAEDSVHEKVEPSDTQPAPAPSRMPVVITTSDGYDSDDSLQGYESSPSSSRSPSPTPSELAEREKDPSLGVGIKKISRPVYLAQLGQMVRSTSGAKQTDPNIEADTIEMALNSAEELIRRKRDYGTELEENAVNLVHGFIGLQDNYELDGFEMKRQLALNSLVACCPRKAAPTLIEEFFKNQYSVDQRYAMLNALAIGARELAKMTIPTSFASHTTVQRTSFPSKRLPDSSHQKYIGDPVLQILDGISRTVIERGRDAIAEKVPEIIRERKLRISKPAKIVPLDERGAKATSADESHLASTFIEVAAEFFIAPLINRFWLFLRDEQTREEHTAHRQGRSRYYGAGTGLILNPLVLVHFLGTLAVLVHTSTNSAEWLAIIAPDALELAVTLGTRPMSIDNDEEKLKTEDLNAENESKGTEASVLSTSLELALVVLDGCLQLDGGRSMSLEHTAILMGVGEWAGNVFSRLEKGVRVEGGGGAQEVRLQRAAAGVLLKVDELTSRWQRSMIQMQ